MERERHSPEYQESGWKRTGNYATHLGRWGKFCLHRKVDIATDASKRRRCAPHFGRPSRLRELPRAGIAYEAAERQPTISAYVFESRSLRHRITQSIEIIIRV